MIRAEGTKAAHFFGFAAFCDVVSAVDYNLGLMRKLVGEGPCF